MEVVLDVDCHRVRIWDGQHLTTVDGQELEGHPDILTREALQSVPSNLLKRAPLLQLCRGVSGAEAMRYRLPANALEACRYLNSSGCTSIEGTNDAQEFERVRSAMAAVGLSGVDQDQVRSQGLIWTTHTNFPCSDLHNR